MVKTPSQPADLPKAPEITGFEGGLQKIRERVSQLLVSQNLVTVAINGAGPGVGKTTLAGEIAKSFLAQNVPVGICLDEDNFGIALKQYHFYCDYYREWSRGIFVMEGKEPPHGIRSYRDKDVRKNYDERFERGMKTLGVPLNQIDIWVAIFSAQNPFSLWQDQPYDPFEDVIIRNEHASSSK